MNFLHDKHSRYYCIFIVTLVLLLFLMGIAVIDTQTAATKEMFLTHNNAIATSLLEEGISKEVKVEVFDEKKYEIRNSFHIDYFLYLWYNECK